MFEVHEHEVVFCALDILRVLRRWAGILFWFCFFFLFYKVPQYVKSKNIFTVFIGKSLDRSASLISHQSFLKCSLSFSAEGTVLFAGVRSNAKTVQPSTRIVINPSCAM
jgi:hypothetical protein